MERKRFETKQELTELRLRQEEHEQRMWQEKIDAELQATHKRLKLEKEARSTTAKMPKLIITPFKGRSKEVHKNRSAQKRHSAICWKWSSKRASKDSKPEAW